MNDLRTYTTRGQADLKTKSVLKEVLTILVNPIHVNAFIDHVSPKQSQDMAEMVNIVLEARLSKVRQILVSDRAECQRATKQLQERCGDLDAIIGLLRNED